MSVTVAIPARLHSSRLPRKVLIELGGRPLLAHVHDVAVRADCGPVVVLTDSDEVADAVRAFGGEVRVTDPHHQSGTARIAATVDSLDSDIVVNLQGDAPLTDPAVVGKAAAEAVLSGAAVTLPVYPLHHEEDLRDPATVKVVRAPDGRVLYCSRAAVPYVRDAPAGNWVRRASFWAHAGVYAYSREFLTAFHELPASCLENAEQLEQLRWIEAGTRIHSFVVEPQGRSVDTPADLEAVRRALEAGVSA